MTTALKRLRWHHIGYVAAVIWAVADLPQAVMGTWHPDHATQLVASFWAINGMFMYGRSR